MTNVKAKMLRDKQESDVTTVCGGHWNGVVHQIQCVCVEDQGRAEDISSNVIDTEAQGKEASPREDSESSY